MSLKRTIKISWPLASYGLSFDIPSDRITRALASGHVCGGADMKRENQIQDCLLGSNLLLGRLKIDIREVICEGLQRASRPQARRQAAYSRKRKPASCTVAADQVAKSAADGHTLMTAAAGATVINPHLMTLPYDTNR